MIRRLAKEHELLITVEEGAIGGFGAHVSHFLSHEGLLDYGLKFRPLVMPDIYMDQAKPEDMYIKSGLDRAGIMDTAFRALGAEQKILPLSGA